MHHSFISCFFHILVAGEKSSPQETKGSVSLSANIADMRIPSKITCNCYTNVFDINQHFQEPHLLRYRKLESSRKHLRTKVTPDFHLTYSKNGGNLGS